MSKIRKEVIKKGKYTYCNRAFSEEHTYIEVGLKNSFIYTKHFPDTSRGLKIANICFKFFESKPNDKSSQAWNEYLKEAIHEQAA